MVKIKICGITNKVDALRAAGLGAEMLGFIFYKGSKRYVEPKVAEDIINELPPGIGRVGVFVNEDYEKVMEVAEDALLDTLQFHGDETPDYCSRFKDKYKVIKAFKIKDKSTFQKVNNYDTDIILFDTYSDGGFGGTGKVFSWELLEDFEFLKPVMLSGGLTPENVADAIKRIAPFGVDVSTGVESSPGRKDIVLMKAFVDQVRKAE